MDTRLSQRGLCLSVVLTAIILVGGCTTPYQRKGFTGGYEDFQVRPGVHYVEVRGNGFTQKLKLVKYFHRRAREICSQAGLDEYVILSEEHEMKTEAFKSPKSYSGTTTLNRDSRGAYYGNTTLQEHGGEQVTFTKHTVSGYVECHTSKKGQPGDGSQILGGGTDAPEVPAAGPGQLVPPGTGGSQTRYCMVKALDGNPHVYCYATLGECLHAPCAEGSQRRCDVLVECELVVE